MGSPLSNYKVYGKPNPEPYVLAEELLARQAGLQRESSFGTILAIGDNPESDIAGATAAGEPDTCPCSGSSGLRTVMWGCTMAWLAVVDDVMPCQA